MTVPPQPPHGAAQPYAAAHPQDAPFAYGAPAASADPRTAPARGAGFGESVRRFYARYAQFRGRSGRAEFWWTRLYLMLVLLAFVLLIALVGVNQSTSPYASESPFTPAGSLLILALMAFVLAQIVPNIALYVRRLHDAGLSGWLCLLALIPGGDLIMMLVAGFLPPKPEGARFDR